MAETQKAGAKAKETVLEGSLLDSIVDEGRIAKEPAAKERGKELIKEFVNQVLDGSMTVSRDVESMINARIAQIDHLLSIQLNEILHHPSFQKLESSWRGLKYLLDQSETSDQLKQLEAAAGTDQNVKLVSDNISSTDFGSFETSNNSGTLVCMRKAISYCAIRV